VPQLVREDSAQLVLREQLADPGGDRNSRVLRIASRGKGVRLLLRDHVQLGHRQARPGGQIADHLVQARVLFLGDRLRPRCAQSDLVAEEVHHEVEEQSEGEEEGRALRSTDQRADDDEQTAEAGEQDGGPDRRAEVGTLGGCHSGSPLDDSKSSASIRIRLKPP
jgi:hypothetical protein